MSFSPFTISPIKDSLLDPDPSRLCFCHSIREKQDLSKDLLLPFGRAKRGKRYINKLLDPDPPRIHSRLWPFRCQRPFRWYLKNLFHTFRTPVDCYNYYLHAATFRPGSNIFTNLGDIFPKNSFRCYNRRIGALQRSRLALQDDNTDGNISQDPENI